MILGMVGWRGMVGSVLMGRMLEENDFAHVEKTIFFSTCDHFVSGWGLHQGSAPAIARVRLGWLLD